MDWVVNLFFPGVVFWMVLHLQSHAWFGGLYSLDSDLSDFAFRFYFWYELFFIYFSIIFSLISLGKISEWVVWVVWKQWLSYYRIWCSLLRILNLGFDFCFSMVTESFIYLCNYGSMCSFIFGNYFSRFYFSFSIKWIVMLLACSHLNRVCAFPIDTLLLELKILRNW